MGSVGIVGDHVGLRRVESQDSRSARRHEWTVRHNGVETLVPGAHRRPDIRIPFVRPEGHCALRQCCDHERRIYSRVCRHDAPIHDVKSWLTECPLIWVDGAAVTAVPNRYTADKMRGGVAIDYLGQ